MKTIEIKIPDNTQFEKAEVIGGMLVTSFKEKEEFKRGDIVYCEYYDENELVSWITLVKKILSLEPKDTKIDCHALYMISTNTKRVTPYLELDTDQSADCSVRLATPSEQQLLFSALAKKGKYWDAEALEVKEYLEVPESIGIYSYSGVTDNCEGDGLHIGFNDNKQMLWVNTNQAVYSITPNGDDARYLKVRCYLQPTIYKDLKVGDTFFCSLRPDFDNLNKYYKKLADTQCRVGNNNHDVILTDFDLSMDAKFYKLIPIQ